MAEELYTGPKFETVFLNKETPSHHLLSELMQWCSVFHKENLAPSHETGTAGNLSFRLDPGSNAFCITGAGLIAKCKLKADDFVIVEDCSLADKKVFVKGVRKPSSESMMHFVIYKTLPEVSAVFHGHHEGLLMNAHLLNIPVTKKVCDYGSEELVESIQPLLGKHNFFIIREHGFLSMGSTLDEAGMQVLFLKNKLSE